MRIGLRFMPKIKYGNEKIIFLKGINVSGFLFNFWDADIKLGYKIPITPYFKNV